MQPEPCHAAWWCCSEHNTSAAACGSNLITIWGDCEPGGFTCLCIRNMTQQLVFSRLALLHVEQEHVWGNLWQPLRRNSQKVLHLVPAASTSIMDAVAGHPTNFASCISVLRRVSSDFEHSQQMHTHS